jgi:hypothetical protein
MSESEVARLIPIRHRAPGKAVVNRPASVEKKMVAETGFAHFRNDDVDVKEADDETTLYFDRATGKLVGKVRFWNTRDYELVVIFDPDGAVIGKTLYRYTADYEPWFRSVPGG